MACRPRTMYAIMTMNRRVFVQTNGFAAISAALASRPADSRGQASGVDETPIQPDRVRVVF